MIVFISLIIIFSLTYNNPKKIESFSFNENISFYKISNQDNNIKKTILDSKQIEKGQKYKDNFSYLNSVYFITQKDNSYSFENI